MQEWKPEPLIPVETRQQQFKCPTCFPQTNSIDLMEKELIISGYLFLFYLLNRKHGINVLVEGKELMNCSSHDLLGFSQSHLLLQQAKKTLRRYGVGTCGPRGFYGTLDVHLEFEEKFAKFLGVEASILYSQAFSAVVSTIPAFAKRGDIIVADEDCSIAIQKGIQLSRSNIFYFHHNDMKDLENILHAVELRYPKSTCRKFLIVEGLFQCDCSIVPLDELMELKKRFKYRLIVDETLSIGSLGENGRGVTEYYGISANNVDIIVGSLAHSFGAGGGFCAGSVQIVDHQRLSSQAYCFSASLPAILTTTALLTMEMMQDPNQKLFKNLSELITKFNESVPTKGKLFRVIGSPDSPIKYLVPIEQENNRDRIVNEFIRKAYNGGFLFSTLKSDTVSPIKLTISIGYSKSQLTQLINFLNKNI